MNIPKSSSALTPKSELPWSTKDAIIRLIIYYVLILIFLLTLQLGITGLVKSDQRTTFIIEASINGIIGLLLSFVFLSFDGKKFKVLGFSYHTKLVLLIVVALIATSIALFIAYMIEIYGGVVSVNDITTNRYKIENLSDLSILSNYLAIAIITFFGIALGEEIMFRGYILSLFEDRSGFLKAAAISSVLFGLLHSFLRLSYTTYVLNGMIAVGVSAIIFGFVFAYAYKISGNNLILPILIHGIWDSIIFLFNNDYIYKTVANVIFEITSQLVAAVVLILILYVVSKAISLTNEN